MRALDKFRAAIDVMMRIAGVLLLVALVGVFAYTAVALVGHADTPPRLADLAPTAVPTHVSATPPALEPQLRGPYDPNERLLALLAVVTPLVTTMVGYYFGQEKGAAQAAQASREQQQAIDVAVDLLKGQAASPDDFYKELRAKNITVRNA